MKKLNMAVGTKMVSKSRMMNKNSKKRAMIFGILP
jgi:hypothetical protein